MKTKVGILAIVLLAAIGNLKAQNQITATAVSYDISDNLDLEAVATLFGKSRNLEDFERRLNDPETQISNLDLNQDGYVDYLRVLDNSDNGVSEVIIQAVLGDNEFQDVATIETQRNYNGNPTVQIIGDPYLYGPDYVLLPVYVRTPLIFSFFWGPSYRPWHSPYYWGYYPSYFHYWRPMPTFRYHQYVYGHINRRNDYHFSNSRIFNYSGDNHNNFRRNDYGSKYPGRSFNERNSGIRNSFELNQRRPSNTGYAPGRNVDRQIQRQRPEPVRNPQQNRVIERRRPESGQQINRAPAQNRSNSQIQRNTNKSAPTRNTRVETNRRRTNVQAAPNQRTTVRKSAPATNKTTRKERVRRREENK